MRVRMLWSALCTAVVALFVEAGFLCVAVESANSMRTRSGDTLIYERTQ